MKGKMTRLIHYMCVMIAVLALASVIIAVDEYATIRPVAAYNDIGDVEFIAAEWYSKVEELHLTGSAPSLMRYMYYIRYMDVDSGDSSYSYHERVPSSRKAKEAVNSEVRIKRRVLSDGDNYTTIPAGQTKYQWLNKIRIRCFAVSLCSVAYLACFIIVYIKRRLRE